MWLLEMELKERGDDLGGGSSRTTTDGEPNYGRGHVFDLVIYPSFMWRNRHAGAQRSSDKGVSDFNQESDGMRHLPSALKGIERLHQIHPAHFNTVDHFLQPPLNPSIPPKSPG